MMRRNVEGPEHDKVPNLPFLTVTNSFSPSLRAFVIEYTGKLYYILRFIPI